MRHSSRPSLNASRLLLLAAALAGLSACGGGGSSGGTTPPPPTTNNSVVATPSPTGTVTGTTHASTSYTLTFTSSDTNALTNLSVTAADLTGLPTGWTGPTTFTCASVTSGTGCKLTLTYAPTAATSGSFTLHYAYTNNAGTAKTGSTVVNYASTDNTVVATPSISGTVSTIVNGNTPFSITFTTSDGNPATGFSVHASDLGTLAAAGWTAPAAFTCASVSVGSGCVLNLRFSPTATSIGAFTLNFDYTNNLGTAKTGQIVVDYTTSVANNVNAIVSPSGQITATAPGGSQTVTVTFRTDNGAPATSFSITAGLDNLPAGWTYTPVAPNTGTAFACPSVSDGNSCQLVLVYAPSAVTTTPPPPLHLAYSFTDDSGAPTPRTGSVDIGYAATENDNNVTATITPSGPFSIAPNAPNETVHVIFNSDDANNATSLTVTDLSGLPAGWTASGSTFTCATVAHTGTGCQLDLTFAPTAGIAAGAVDLHFNYTSSTGNAKQGALQIPFSSAAAHAYIANGPGGVVYCAINTSTGALQSCHQTAAGINAIAGIGFNNSGAAFLSTKVGGTNVLRICDVNGDGSLTYCGRSGQAFADPSGVEVKGSDFYAAEANQNINACDIGSDGSLLHCTEQDLSHAGNVAGGANIIGFYIGDTRAYFADLSGDRVYLCTVSNGFFSACATTGGTSWNTPTDIKLVGNFAYVTNRDGASVSVCSVTASTGALTACQTYPTVVTAPRYIALYAGHAYITDRTNNEIDVCAWDSTTGAITGCANQGNLGGLLADPYQVKIR